MKRDSVLTAWWAWAVAGAGAMVASMPAGLLAVTVFCVVDVVMGYGAAFLRSDVAREPIWKGVVRKGLLLLGVGVGFALDRFLAIGAVHIAGLDVGPSVGLFIAGLGSLHELTSILEHLRASGALRSRAMDALTARLRSIDSDPQEQPTK